ncbi:MAG: O-antigen ligase family protein [Lentisphaeria bacterium]|jgi:O-antigen ligase
MTEATAESGTGRSAPRAPQLGVPRNARAPRHLPAATVLLLLLAWLAATTGGIEPQTLPWIAAAAAGATLLAPPPARGRLLAAAGLTALAGLGWFFLTTLPLPPALAFLAGQDRQTLFSTATAFLAESAPPPTGKAAAAVRLSLNTPGTLRCLLLLILALACARLTAGLAGRQRLRLLWILLPAATALLLLGLLRQHSQPAAGATATAAAPHLPWLFTWFDKVRTTSSIWPFVNRNHFASCAAMLAMPALALAAHAAPDTPAARAGRPWRIAGRILAGICFLTLAALVFLSESRGGTVAFLAGTILTAFLCLHGRRHTLPTAAVLLAIAALLLLFLLPAETVQRRLDTLRQPLRDSSFGTRADNWRASGRLWRRFPLAGGGLESFHVLFPIHKRVPGGTLPFYAENEYVQLLADAGLAGLALAGALASGWLALVLKGGRPPPAAARRRELHGTLPPALRAAALGAGTVILVHAATDFALRIPLNAALAGGLLALGLPEPDARPSAAAGTRMAALAASGLLLLALLTGIRFARLPAPELATGGGWTGTPWPRLREALALAPSDWSLWYEFGTRLQPAASAAEAAPPAPPPLDRGPWTAAGNPAQGALALRAFRQAAAGNPADPRLWLFLAKAELAAGNPGQTAAALDRAVKLQPSLAPRAQQLLRQTFETPAPNPE